MKKCVPRRDDRAHARELSYFMNRFRKMGFIEYNGNMQVNRALLTLLHE
jgi:hypothetical protein